MTRGTESVSDDLRIKQVPTDMFFTGTNTAFEEPPVAPQLPPRTDFVASDSVIEAEKAASVVLVRLEELLRQEECDEYGQLRPTTYAYQLATSVITEASTDLGPHFPKGSVCTDSQGGIRITWFNADREVELVLPSSRDRGAHVYHGSISEYDVEPYTTSNRALSRWLRWLTGQA